MESALEAWAVRESGRHPGLLGLACFGSYARGDAGVGSDLDLLAIVERSQEPIERRTRDWDLNALPVPVDLLVYTRDEWTRLLSKGGRFPDTLRREARWLVRAAELDERG